MDNYDFPGNSLPEERPKTFFSKHQKLVWACGALALFILLELFILGAPSGFPVGKIVEIKEGASLRGVSRDFKNEKIIRSRILFEAFVILYGGERRVISTDYLFEKKLAVFEVARRVTDGRRNLAPVKITIPEGFNTEEMASIIGSKLPNFIRENFVREAEEKIGYLFPDTYFFMTADGEEEVLEAMSENYEDKISPLRPELEKIKKSEHNIIVMASLIEREARGEEDREMISGILWKRLSIGMALQADAAPVTYERRGLPERPIGNPGLKAIKASMYPKSSPYLYYVHDKEGNTYYAKNFTEHRQNIEKYLK